jgi:acetyl-CoA C-acetyltransferase
MDVAIVGIGLHPFGRFEGVTGADMGAYAVREALKDASLGWKDMQFAYGGSMDAGTADSLVNNLGLTGLQFINVFNGCATGGSALFNAYTAIVSGAWDLGLAVGFDKHPRGAFTVLPEKLGLPQWYGQAGLCLSTQFFAMKINKYMHDFGITEDSLVRVAEKAFRYGAMNPLAWRRNALSYEEIANSRMINNPLRQYMFCSPGEGGAALVLASAKRAKQITSKPIYLKAAIVRTRKYGSFEVFSPHKPLDDVPSPSVQASQAAYEGAGVSPEDVDIAQLQDTETGAEIMHMAENSLCRDGDQEKMIQEGQTEITGRLPINTDGGLLANGEPVGASGLRQVYEICLQMRGEAGPRQVQKTLKIGYTHVYGGPGVSGVNILQK